jgi:hypothetical protein
MRKTMILINLFIILFQNRDPLKHPGQNPLQSPFTKGGEHRDEKNSVPPFEKGGWRDDTLYTIMARAKHIPG